VDLRDLPDSVELPAEPDPWDRQDNRVNPDLTDILDLVVCQELAVHEVLKGLKGSLDLKGLTVCQDPQDNGELRARKDQ